MPEGREVDAAASIRVMGVAGAAGVREEGTLADEEEAGVAPDSTRVPQEPHSGQRPSHLGEE